MCTGTELIVPLLMAASAAAAVGSSISQGVQQTQQQQYQAKLTRYQSQVAANNAQNMQYQAENERRKGEMEQEAVNRERDKMRRDYEDQAGANRSMLAASGVDMTSGSAAESLLGNGNRFAGDVMVNRYNHSMAGHDADARARQYDYQAAQYNSQGNVSLSNASWLDRTSGNLGTTLLTSGIKGLNYGLSMYGKK